MGDQCARERQQQLIGNWQAENAEHLCREEYRRAVADEPCDELTFHLRS